MVVVVDDWILGSLERPTNRPKGADTTRRKDAAARDRDGVWRVRETAEIRVPVLW